MKAVILAGGLGTRLRPFTQVIPKPLLPIGGKSIIEIQILNLKKCGVEEVILATNYKSEYIESFVENRGAFGIPVSVSKESQPLGTCGPVALLKDVLKEPFLVMNGDILTLLDFGKLYDYAIQSGAILTVTTVEIHTPFEFGKVLTDGKFIIGVEEKPAIKMEIIAGIYVMTPAVFKYIPENSYFGMDQLIKALLSEGQAVARYLTKEYWLDIGRAADYDKAQLEYPKFSGEKSSG